jgi:hypothetical protein
MSRKPLAPEENRYEIKANISRKLTEEKRNVRLLLCVAAKLIIIARSSKKTLLEPRIGLLTFWMWRLYPEERVEWSLNHIWF